MDIINPRAWRSGGLWRLVAACNTGVVALLEDCIMEAWRPAGKDDEVEGVDTDE